MAIRLPDARFAFQRPNSRLETQWGIEKRQDIDAQSFRPESAMLTPTRRASEGRSPDMSAAHMSGERLVSRKQPLARASG